MNIRTSCYTTSNQPNDYIKEWTDNTTTDKLIQFNINPLLPDALYRQWNDTHYQWCGPLLMIAECFAKLTKTK